MYVLLSVDITNDSINLFLYLVFTKTFEFQMFQIFTYLDFLHHLNFV